MRNFLKLCALFVGVATAVAIVLPLLPAFGGHVALGGGAWIAPFVFLIAIDKTRNLPSIVVANTAQDNVRAATTAENNVRTERYNMRVRGQVDITAAGTGLRNRGSILAAITDTGFSDGGTDKVVIDARLNRFVAEQFSPSPLSFTRLAAAGVQAATQLEEIMPIMLSAPRTINAGDTKYVEVNKQSQLQVFITPLRLITRLAAGGALVGTVTNLTVTVEQIFDQLTTVAPWLTAYVRQIVQDVAGANPALKIDLRGSRYVRGLAIQQDTNEGEVADIINELVLRGDNASILGDRGIPFRDLVLAQGYENGGAIPDGYLLHDFCNYARLTASWNPNQDTNLRIEAGVQPSVGNTGSKIRVAMLEYERTAVTADPMPYNI